MAKYTIGGREVPREEWLGEALGSTLADEILRAEAELEYELQASDELTESLGPAASPDFADALSHFTGLDLVARELERLLSVVSKAKERYGPTIAEGMALNGLTSANANGLRVEMRQSKVCNKRGSATQEQVIAALRAHGMAELTGETYAAGKVKERLFAMIRAGDTVPEDLAKCFRLEVVPILSTVKAPPPKSRKLPEGKLT